MDFQTIADSIFAPTCIVSVEKKKDGGYGDVWFDSFFASKLYRKYNFTYPICIGSVFSFDAVSSTMKTVETTPAV